MRFLLDNGYYLNSHRDDISTVTDDSGRGFIVRCDNRMTQDEVVRTMAEVIPFITPRIA